MSKKDNNQDLDLKLVKDLIGVMDKGKLSKLHIKEKNGFEVLLERENPVAPIASIASHERHHFVPAHPHEALPHAAPKIEESKPGHFVKSPMVGTIYKSPSPDHAPFVVIGDRVEENTVVCIVEAMKVMNEVKAGKSGVIKEILFDNMQPVEFGTKLFRIE